MKTLFSVFLLLSSILGIGQESLIHTCTEMPLSHFSTISNPSPIPDMAARAVSYKPMYGLYWTNGSTIKIKFLDGDAYLREKVKKYASLWTQYANLTFKFVEYGHADIRVSFVQNGSSWSVIGKQSLQLSQNQASMNFGWLNKYTPEYEFKRTILHEFGHALGLLHEHQNPTGGIPWNRSAVYSHYWESQGWDQQTTYKNVIQKAKRNRTQFSIYDPASIMHYPVSPKLTNGEYQVGMNKQLSLTDITYIRQLYPGKATANTSYPPPSSNPPKPYKPVETAKYIVSISNQLGQNQIEERVDLYLGGEKYTFRLNEDGKTEQSFRFRMKAGKYPYRLSSESTYAFYKKKWNGWKYVRKKIEKTIYGSGSGTLEVEENDTLSLYGSYDQNTGRMKIYLGK